MPIRHDRRLTLSDILREGKGHHAQRCLSNAFNTSPTTAATKASNNLSATAATKSQICFLALGLVHFQRPLLFSAMVATKRRIQRRSRFLAIGFVHLRHPLYSAGCKKANVLMTKVPYRKPKGQQNLSREGKRALAHARRRTRARGF